jgi:hypothetical protein
LRPDAALAFDKLPHVGNGGQPTHRKSLCLGEKTDERERILLLFCRNRIALPDAEAQLEDITREEAALRQQLSGFEAQKALAEAYEAHLTEASLFLHRLQERVAEIDQTNDVATKRQVIELLVLGIQIDTLARQEGRDKGYTVTVKYALLQSVLQVSLCPGAAISYNAGQKKRHAGVGTETPFNEHGFEACMFCPHTQITG